MRLGPALLALAVTSGIAAGAGAGATPAEPPAQAIVDRALEHNAFGFRDAVARVTLVLRAASGAERTRLMEIRAAERGGTTRTLVRFHAPADVAGTGFLVLSRSDGGDEQYLYMPAIGKVKRITSNQRQQKFMGTDLTYADLEWESLKRSDLRRLDDAKVGPYDAYVIESRPRAGSDSAYGKTVTWIEKTSFVPLRVDFYDADREKVVKTLAVRRLERRDGRWVAMESSVRDLVAGSETRMQVTDLDTKARLDDAEFTERALAGG